MLGIPPVGEGYRRNTIRIIEGNQPYHGVSDYSRFLGFERVKDFLEFIPVKALVLDVGSGEGGLHEELPLFRSDIKVISLNPALAGYHFRKEFGSFGLAALNPNLPFKDNSFDTIFDLLASIYHAKTYGVDEFTMVKEIVRVTKPGGRIALGPLYSNIKSFELQKVLVKTKTVEFQRIDFEIPDPDRKDIIQAFYIRKL